MAVEYILVEVALNLECLLENSMQNDAILNEISVLN